MMGQAKHMGGCSKLDVLEAGVVVDDDDDSGITRGSGIALCAWGAAGALHKGACTYCAGGSCTFMPSLLLRLAARFLSPMGRSSGRAEAEPSSINVEGRRGAHLTNS